jgi:hypothetical protein
MRTARENQTEFDQEQATERTPFALLMSSWRIDMRVLEGGEAAGHHREIWQAPQPGPEGDGV